jgi:hypothetical protein
MIQFNEVYQMHTYSWDGGAFDIDWGSENVTIQYNYAHDNDGYGVQLYAPSGVISNSIIRYNIFSNNDRKAGGNDGEIWINSAGGKFNGIQIYNNTVFRSPTNATPAVGTGGFTTTGGLLYLFENNIIYSTGNLMTQLPAAFQSDNNAYWTTSASSPSWTYNGVTYSGFAAYVAATRQDQHGVFGDPLLDSPTYHAVGAPTSQFRVLPSSPAIKSGAVISSPGSRDFFGNAVAPGSVVNIGADAADPGS